MDIQVGIFKEAGKYEGTETHVAEVAMYQEFGTENMKAQPFLRIIFAENKNKYIALYKDLLNKVITGRLTTHAANKIIGEEFKKDIQARVPVDTGVLKKNIDFREK